MLAQSRPTVKASFIPASSEQAPQPPEIAAPSTHGAECSARNDKGSKELAVTLPFCLCEADVVSRSNLWEDMGLPRFAGSGKQSKVWQWQKA